MTTLKTYRAPTMAQALAEVKKDLGAEAVIINTRSVKSGGLAGLGAKPLVEITASPAGAPSATPTPRPPATARPIGPAPAALPRAAATPPAPLPAATRPGAPQPKPARAAAPETDWTPLEFTQLMSDLSAEPARPAAPERSSPPAPRPVAPEVVVSKPAPIAPAPIAPRPEVKPAAPVVEFEAKPSPAAASTPRVQPVIETPTLAGPARLAVKAPLAPVSESARASLEEELASIRRMMGQVLQFSRRAAARDASAPIPPVGGVPEALQQAYAGLLDAAVAPELADHLLAGVQAQLEPAELEDPELVHLTLTRLLAEAMPIVRTPGRPGRQADGRPLTLALVGPTGVGKTTTIAKLAALYKLRHGKRVGLLTTDTYRIAAVEQLRTYARIIGLPLKVASDAQDLADGLKELQDVDVILIDTAGRSPSDQARLDELSACVRAARPHETHLVLAATAAEPVLLRTADRFRALAPDRLILTKLDEAPQAGPVASIPARTGLPLSYLTTGQEVPDDLELAAPDRLARRILGASAPAVVGA